MENRSFRTREKRCHCGNVISYWQFKPPTIARKRVNCLRSSTKRRIRFKLEGLTGSGHQRKYRTVPRTHAEWNEYWREKNRARRAARIAQGLTGAGKPRKRVSRRVVEKEWRAFRASLNIQQKAA